METGYSPATLPARPATCRFDFSGGRVPAGTVLAETESAYAILAAVKVGEDFVDEPGHWLLVPKSCVTSWADLPRDWEIECWMLLAQLFGDDESRWPAIVRYRLRGREAGNTVAHLHEHVRLVGSEGLVLELRAK